MGERPKLMCNSKRNELSHGSCQTSTVFPEEQALITPEQITGD